MMFVGKPLLYIATENDVVGGGAVEQPEQPQKVAQQTITLNNVDDEQDRLRIPSVGANYSSYYEENSNVENIVSETWSPRDQANSANTKVLTSPAVRKLGKENNIDLGTVLGTGQGGRASKADVCNIINYNSKNTAGPISSSLSLTLAQEKMIHPTPLEDTVIPIY